MLVRHILSTVCLRLRPFFQLSFKQYVALCVISLSISLLIIVRIFVPERQISLNCLKSLCILMYSILFIIERKYESLAVVRVGSWNNVCLAMILLMYMW